MTEDYAPGIRKYRQSIGKLIPGRFHYSLPNRIINSQVEDAIKQFRVLVIKTNTILPYSNICIELDSGYWSADSEAELRNRIERLEGSKPSISSRCCPLCSRSLRSPLPFSLPPLRRSRLRRLLPLLRILHRQLLQLRPLLLESLPD